MTDTPTAAASSQSSREKPTLPRTSTPRPEGNPATYTRDSPEIEITAVTVLATLSPTRQEPTPSSLPPTLTLTPTPFPNTLTATPTDGPTPLPPDEPWPDPTRHAHPVSESPRHGVAVAFGSGANSGLRAESSSWTYSWTPYVPETGSPIQHIPMLSGGPLNGLPSKQTIVDMDERADHDYWLVFNECEQHWQCDTSPQEAAKFYHDEVVYLLYEQGADDDAKLIVGGINAHPCGILWLTQFLISYEANYGLLPRAGWHFHIYPEIEPNTWPISCSGQWDYDDTLFSSPEAAFDLWLNRMEGVLAFIQEYGGPEDEIWITEMGCLNYGNHQVRNPVCQRSGFMVAYAPMILDWLNKEGRWVTRYAWFTNWDDNYWDATKLFSSIEDSWTYSSLGRFYSQIQPANSIPIPSP